MSQMITVTTAAELNAALIAAVGGETLCLEAGHYGHLMLTTDSHPQLAFATPVTLAGVGAPLPVVFSGLHLSGVTHLVFEGIVFDTKDPDPVPDNAMVDAGNIAANPSADAPFKLVACADIAFRGCIFQGKNGQGGAKISCGLTLSACTGLRVNTCRLHGFSHGIVVLGSENLTITGCEISAIGMDAILLIDTRSVRIENNFLHDLGPQSAANLPVTMLHFRTKAANKAHRDVIVRNNTLDAGTGTAARGIVMTADFGPEAASDPTPRDAANPDRRFACEGLRIEGNLIVTRHIDGITLGPVKALTIQNNSVLSGSNALGSKTVAVPHITIDPRAQDVTVIKNAVLDIVGPSPRTGWTVRQNAFIQPDDPTLPGWYGDVFETPLQDESTPSARSTPRFVARKGSMLYNLGAGVLTPARQETLDPTTVGPTTAQETFALEPLVLERPRFVPKLVSKLSVVPRLMPPCVAAKSPKSIKQSAQMIPASKHASRQAGWARSAFVDCSVPLM